ncbi:MAG: hypothetical protein JJ863_39085 [Deltaproteobacteria bacterium]|nr:hypothetical protein [Deltaproteobacteria bacterium]
MTRSAYVAWLWVLGIALAICALIATVGAGMRLEGPTTIDCTDAPADVAGHVRFEGCVVDATDAILVETADGDRAAVWVATPDWTKRPLAWAYSAAPEHVRWAHLRGEMDEGERRRYLDRHQSELRSSAELEGWLETDEFPAHGPARTIRPAPRLGLDRPLEPLSVGGSLAAALFLLLLVGLVTRRRRWREEQSRWAHDHGVHDPARPVSPRPF